MAGRINAINAESQREADCIAARQAAARQKARVRETLASLWYETITVEDFKLDGKELAASGRRVAISGYYHFLGEDAEYL